MPKIFITHAEANAHVARALVGLLQTGTRIDQADVFCSSDEGQGIQTGSDIRGTIRSSLEETSLAIPLISDEYLISDWCQWELGAIWLKQCRVFPLFIRPSDPGDLGGPLQGIRGEYIDDTAGLDRLYDVVNRTFSLDLATDRWHRERDNFVGALPSLLSRYQPSARMEERQVEVRRQRYADAMHEYHRAFHSLRDAAFVTIAHGATEQFLEEFVAHLQLAVDALADAFSIIVGASCRVCIKQTRPVHGEQSGPPIVFDLLRSNASVEYRLENADLIQENTDFEDLLERKVNVFHSNDLVQLHANGQYKNSHWKTGVPTPAPYVSAIVWPIRKLRYSTSNIEHLLGFLCVDTKTAGAFLAPPAGRLDLDFGFGAAFADTIYHVLQPWIGEEGPFRDQA